MLLKQLELEARVGIEPTMQLLQSRALPLGYPATGTTKLILFHALIKLSFVADNFANRRNSIRARSKVTVR
jgi:hypothetical protein